MLLSTPQLDEALAWALAYWLREGDTALAALSIGPERDEWVLSGEELRSTLRQRLWQVSPGWSTSATEDLLQDDRWLVSVS